MSCSCDNENTYLGFDLSTQKLKAIQLNASLALIAKAEVQFDSDLPEFRTTGGVNAGSENNEYYVQPVMWVKALDIVLDRLIVQGADLSTVIAIGGSAQQHGSLFWSRHGIATLKTLNPDKFLHVQIDDSAFVLTRTPVWMDGSTNTQCRQMEAAIGGEAEMARITGSKCYQRFTGPQIRKVYQQRSRAYEETQRISLVSSFLASLFLGEVAPIDYSDGSGMNLFDIRFKVWSNVCLNACAPDLGERLGNPVSTLSVLGDVSPFYVQRFGFPHTCKVTSFTGDNPSALSGLLIRKSWLAFSLGTSDTIMMNLEQPPSLQEGHVLCHPTESNQYMGLLCFRNGSLVRDAIKAAQAHNKWDEFDTLLDSTPRGNFGNMALHFHSKEIIPSLQGTLRWNKNHTINSPDASTGITSFGSPEIEIRALIEGQMLHRRAVASDMGFNFGEATKIVVTGGASSNTSILQVIADVFNSSIYIQESGEAALLGAAYRAKYTLYLESLRDCHDDHNTMAYGEPYSYHDYILQFVPNAMQLLCEPSKDSEEIYGPMLERYREMVRALEMRS